MATSDVTAFLMNAKHALNRLRSNVNDPLCPLWNELIYYLRQNQQLICPTKGIKESVIYAALRVMDCETMNVININLDLLTLPYNVIYSIRYGFVEMYIWILSNDLSTINGRKMILSYLEKNHRLAMISLSHNNDFLNNELIGLDAATTSLVLIENIIVFNNEKTYPFSLRVFVNFIDLLLMDVLYKNKVKHTYLICLAALMVFESKMISHCLKAADVSKLYFMMKQRMEQMKEYIDPMIYKSENWNADIQAICMKMKGWAVNVEQSGKTLFDSLNRLELDGNFCILVGKLFIKWNNYKEGIKWYITSICRCTVLIVRIISLRRLSEICRDKGQHVMALKLLNTAKKYCHFYDFVINPIFANKIYFEKRKIIKKRLNKICMYCKSKGKKIKCCTGCMVALYCSKSCQKKHWVSIHNKRCDKSWSKCYKFLKNGLVFSVTQQ
eukprot:488027_1